MFYIVIVIMSGDYSQKDAVTFFLDANLYWRYSSISFVKLLFKDFIS